jgi:hypothetical protein
MTEAKITDPAIVAHALVLMAERAQAQLQAIQAQMQPPAPEPVAEPAE